MCKRVWLITWKFSAAKINLVPKRKKKFKNIPPPVGLEPTTFELEVQHASPLRHGGVMNWFAQNFQCCFLCL